MLSVLDVAEILKVNPMTVYREVQRGNLPAHRIGRALRFAEADIQAYLDQRRTVAPKKTTKKTARKSAKRG